MKVTTTERLKTLIGKKCSIQLQPGISTIETIVDIDLDKNLIVFETVDKLIGIARINLINEVKVREKQNGKR